MLSRADLVTITHAEWIKDKKEIGLHWWTIRTDKTGDTQFRIIGVYNNPPTLTKYDQEKFQVGNTIKLGELSFIPVASGLMAYSELPQGIVLASIGRIRDQLENISGPMAYYVPKCKTRNDNIDPTPEQENALRRALLILMTKGREMAKTFLQKTGLFDAIFEGNEGCPAYPGSLTDGVFEWR